MSMSNEKCLEVTRMEDLSNKELIEYNSYVQNMLNNYHGYLLECQQKSLEKK